MDDGKPTTSDGHRLTRRSLLVAGVGAVTGCSSVTDIGTGSSPTIRAYDLPDIDSESIPEPVVAPSVPVGVDPAHFAGANERVTDLLATLPTPLGPEDVPNGHVRNHLTDAADTATDGLDDARTARTGLLALQALQEAREQARYAAAGWAVAADGQSVGPLRREHGETVADPQSVRDDHEYVGTDPVRAALVHARIEGWLSWVTDADPPRTSDEGELLTVAEWGETAERARALLDDARHLDERFRASLPDDPDVVEETLTRAAEALLADARTRRAELPPEPSSDDWGLEERVVSDIRRDAEDVPVSIGDSRGPASAVVELTDLSAKFRALDRVQERVDAGEISSVESADEVREIRTAAYDAFDTALAESRAPGLARTVLSDISWRVTVSDRELTRHRGDISPAQLDDVVEGYVVATAVARATPAACQQTVDALDGA